VSDAQVEVALRGPYRLNTFDRLVRQLQPLFELDAPEMIKIDLSGLVYLSPAALATLVATVGDLADRGLIDEGSAYVPPSSYLVARYLARMDFEKLFVDDAPEEAFQRRKEDAFRPCQVFTDSDGALTAATDLSQAMTEACALDTGAHIAIWSALQEVAQNVILHAGSPAGGVGVAQRSKSGQVFEMAIADRGVGIPDSLARNPDFAGLSDLAALQVATELGVTGTPGQGEGAGLYVTRVLLRHNGGTLVLRSRSAHLESGLRPIGRNGLPVFPGTLVVLRTRLDRPLRMQPLFRILDREAPPEPSVSLGGGAP
jgi:hypothetical protein